MKRFPSLLLMLGSALALAGCKGSARAPEPAAPAPRTETEAGTNPPLQPVSRFGSIEDEKARSAAIFTEAGRVITHPRCTNCHPADGIPRQGLEQRLHVPHVRGGAKGHGMPSLPCTSCHQEAKTRVVGESLQSIPGNPKWALAPVEMAWMGKSLGEICEQIKDPHRNGGHDLEFIHHHMAEDVLVGWGWAPGEGRQPVPGTQRDFGALIRAWIDTGAHCPVP
ncbi:Isoquinoline 1-oxidoreductase subunit [Stigmatella sp. ncwal1]|uniref:Isoquinoline 1-oxidoreductase subunit n=1 Tax=Stigmatella ashevillensis TaxID=2995309 RepID=A0ABT5DCI3_9BACT|nr:Isoquinoline 1-oxidoreductase subunit [Stigmatella ashevillena]MDC0711341.1 Isoquinoline 1-oxidoreductase subunit [Stigmatella ashevillena]